MKKIYLLLLAGATYFSTNAQVTIANLDLSVGDTILLEQDTLSIIQVNLDSTVGAGQIWDYRSLSSFETDYVHLQSPTAGVWFSEFPDADMMAYNNEDSNYIYLDKTSSSLKVVGFVELSNGDTNLANFEIPFVYFPSSLGTINVNSSPKMIAFQNEAGFDPDGAGPHPYVDSLRVKIIRNFVLEIDAEGVLKLPNGDFDVIRQITKPIVEFHTELLMNGTWDYITPLVSTLFSRDSISFDTSNYQVRFWSEDPNANFAMVGFDLDSTNTMSDGVIEWLDMQPYDVSVAEKSKLINAIYPNPARDIIVLKLKSSIANVSYEISSITGKIVGSGLLTNVTNSIGVSELKSGTYLLNIKSKDRNEVIKFIKK